MFSSILLATILIALSTAFFTLWEHKIIGHIQMRTSLSSAGSMGLLQPFSDMIKLLTKTPFSSLNVTPYIHNYSPFLAFLIPWLLLFSLSSKWESSLICYCLPFLMATLSLSTYPVLLGGWSSSSKYPLMAALRSVAQTFSYEIPMMLVILAMASYLTTMKEVFLIKGSFILLTSMLPMIWLWLLAILAETNRTPFDFAEAESELVSGFNTEFSSGMFVQFFLAEYMTILVFAMLTSSLFISSNSFTSTFSTFLISSLFIWTRASLPRSRYDKLMSLAWKTMTPCILLFMLSLLPQ